MKPKKVRLEASLICQLHCPLCNLGKRQTTERGTGYLKIEDFKTFVTNNPKISEIELAGHAEMFLNPGLVKIIEYAYAKNIKLTANVGTNLNYISDEVCESLVKYKFRSMMCAIDGASQDTYKIYRVGGNFNMVIENIKKINLYKNRYKSKFPLLHWQFVIFGHNEHEIPLAKKLAKKLNMSFTVQLSWDPYWSPLKNKNFVIKETGLPFGDINDYNEKKKDVFDMIMCTQLWIDPQINWDGKLFGCCINSWQDFGNVFSSRFIDTFNNEKMDYAREMLMGKRDARNDIPCTRCYVYKGMTALNRWITAPYIQKTRCRRKIQTLFFEYMPVFITNRLINFLGSKRKFL